MSMRCTVLLFAHLADAAGRREVPLELPRDATVSDAIDALARSFSSIAPFRDPIAIAVNERYVQPDYELEEGDTIALIPPVSGG
jgi:molybdopterin converting factor subunit 1